MNDIKPLKSKKVLCVILVCLLLCTNFTNGQNNKTTNSNENQKTYINFSVSGNQINNTFNIIGDQNNSSQNVTAMIFPDGNSGEYKIAELSFMDGEQEMSVLLKVPAQKGLIELKEGNPNFKLGISIGDISLKAQSISVNVETVVIDKIMKMKASYVKGSFEGIAIHTYTKDGKTFEEPYLVSGDFQFMSPRYKPRKSKN